MMAGAHMDPPGDGNDYRFDRIRPSEKPNSRHVDPQGKQALFSVSPNKPSLGYVGVTCSHCRHYTVISLVRLGKLALPGVIAPVPGLGTKVWARCPVCSERTWLAVQFGS